MKGLVLATSAALAAVVAACLSPSPRDEPRDAGVASPPSVSGVPSGAPDAALAEDTAVPTEASDGAFDVTFAVVSDTHFGHDAAEAKNRALVASLATLEGRAYPKPARGKVEHVRGLLVAGDLTEWGNVEEWDAFRAAYGLVDGGSGAPWPVFEVVGNHDAVHGPWLAEAVAKRHGGTAIYAWSFGSVRFFGLGESAGGAALDALAVALAKLPAATPIVLLVHRPLAGPWSEDVPSVADKARLAELLRGRDVVAIFHGHHHATGRYLWNGIPVFKPGAVKDGAPRLAVVRIVRDSLTVAELDWRARRWVDAVVLPRPTR